jgi:hypothetical protein
MEIQIKTSSEEKPVCSKCNKPLTKEEFKTHNFADMMYGVEEMTCSACFETNDKNNDIPPSSFKTGIGSGCGT